MSALAAPSPEAVPLDFELHPKQLTALQTIADEALYGGAAGGGKSHLMRVAAIVWATAVAGLQIYLFRRELDDLNKNHVEGPKGFRNLLAPWVAAGLVTIVEREIRFWNGSKIYLCHCKDEKDRFGYHGAEIHVLLMDELTTFTETIYRYLRFRVRAVGLPAALTGTKFPRILCSSNPGNIGHAWVKATFINNAEPNELRQMPDSEGGMLRQYIPAKLDDNPSMATDDPGYRARMRGLGSEAQVKAMEDGDWEVVEGAYFDCWSPRNIVRPFEVPKHWLRFMAFDWGSAEPFSTGWYAVASERCVTADGVMIPAGALVRYREWYGSKSPNVGLKMKNGDIGRGILERESADEEISYRTCDPSIFSTHGGPSIAEQMARDERTGQALTINGKRLTLRKADNTRVAHLGAAIGWGQLRIRLIGYDDSPMLFVFSTGTNLIRTLPALQHNPDKPEDIMDGMEDHAPDECRYACNSRPWAKPKPEAKPFTVTTRQPTWKEMMEQQRRNRERD